jgi:hypothetical protein
VRSDEPVNIGWVFRPDLRAGGADRAAEHAGKQVHSVGKTVDGSGRVEVVLMDGQWVKAHRHELIPG